MKTKNAELQDHRKLLRGGTRHRDAAYELGRAAGKVSLVIRSVASFAGVGIDKAKGSFETGYGRMVNPLLRVRIRRIDRPGDPGLARLSPILREIRAIMDISGLTYAIEEMNEIGLKHSDDSLVAGIISKIENLPFDRQEMLAKKFLKRFGSSQFVNGSSFASLASADISEEDCQKMSDLLIECAFHALTDIGLKEDEKLNLRSLVGEISRPIDELIQFYLRPKTVKQKIRRLWRMQRIIIKMIGLVNKLNGLADDTTQPSIEVAAVDIPAEIL